MDPAEADLAYSPGFILKVNTPVVLSFGAIFFLPVVREWTGADPRIVASGFGAQILAHLAISLTGLWRTRPRAAEIVSVSGNLALVGAVLLAAGPASPIAWVLLSVVSWAHASGNGKSLFNLLAVTALPAFAVAAGHFSGGRDFGENLAALCLLSALGAAISVVTAYYKEWYWDVRDGAVVKAGDEAAVKERARIGADLHGTLGAALAEISLWHEVALASGSVELDGPVAKAQARARTALRQLRAMVHRTEIRNRPLGDWTADWRPALQGLCDSAGVELEMEVRHAEAAVDGVAAYHLGKFAQEALTNAIRHARPRLVTVEFTPGPSPMVAVGDDGCGFSAQSVIYGRGLRALAEHAEGLGGRLEIESRPEGGTRVSISFAPVPEPGAAVKRGERT